MQFYFHVVHSQWRRRRQCKRYAVHRLCRAHRLQFRSLVDRSLVNCVTGTYDACHLAR